MSRLGLPWSSLQMTLDLFFSPTPLAVTPGAASAPALRHIQIEGQPISYQLRRARRRTIGFTVGQEGLTVAAPRWVGQGEIEAGLREKGRWILKKMAEQQERQARLETLRITWRDGAVFPYLGQDITARIHPGLTGSELRGTELLLGLESNAHAQQIKDLVQAWMMRQALVLFEQRLNHFAPQLDVQWSRLKLSSAQTRWGSATSDGVIRLNWRLLHFRLPIIDYVVAHELAHLREMNHGPRFWEVVRTVMPDYPQAMEALKEERSPLW
jgi:predicted metal-dependent hydrolase